MSALTHDTPHYEPLGICHLCARRTDLTTCEAFPNGIPLVIATGEFDHHNPYSLDHGIQFEAKPGDSVVKNFADAVMKNLGWAPGPDAHWERTDGRSDAQRKAALGPYRKAVKAAGGPGAWAQSVWGPLDYSDEAQTADANGLPTNVPAYYKTTFAYVELNDTLRGVGRVPAGTPIEPRQEVLIDRLTADIDAAPRVPMDIEVERSLGFSHNINMLGVSGHPDDATLNALVGKNFTDDGFASASVQPGNRGGNVARIYVPVGSKAIWLEADPKSLDRPELGDSPYGENELLLQRGSEFQVTGWKRTADGYWRVDATLIGQGK